MIEPASFEQQFMAKLAESLAVPAEMMTGPPPETTSYSYARQAMIQAEYERIAMQRHMMPRLMVMLVSPRADRIRDLLASRSGRRRRRGERLMQAELRRPIAAFDLDRPLYVDHRKEA